MSISLAEIEKRIINFWKNFNIFQKSLSKNIKNRKFIWVEGPPYANDKPHMGHFLTRIYKDSILRFFTMYGFYAPRKAGWDTHGLPIEVATEKKFGFKDKKEILNYGIEKFNQECKKLVMNFKDIWEKTDERMGFWIDHQNAYVTYDPFYMESCWWILKQIYNKGLLVQEYKVAPYCPRCETILSQAELGMPDAYKKVSDPSIFVKFKIKNKNEYFLVWTTTPWTLPGNLALALNPDFDYFLYQTEEGNIWTHQKLDYQLLKKKKGKELANTYYEPLFEIKNFKPNKNCYKSYMANFVKEDEGTSIVHLAPAYGEEDFIIGKEKELGILNYLDEKGNFNDDLIEGLKIKGLFFKQADGQIIKFLKEKGYLFKEREYLHEYPHCWRCKKPLIYYATKFWLIKVSKIKKNLIENFKKTNWPSKGAANRFYEWLKEAKDWNLSRTRFWGIPLPIWQCEKCHQKEIIESLKELANKFKPKNSYYLMRHCEAVSNVKDKLSSYPEFNFNPLTRKGVSDAKAKARSLKNEKIDIVFSSPILRAKETAMIIADELKIPHFVDERLREIDMGVLEGKSYKDFDEYIEDELTGKRDLNKKIKNGESLLEVKRRTMDFILEMERKYQGKKILILSHGGNLWLVEGEMKCLSNEQLRNFKVKPYKMGEVRKVELMIVPRDEQGEINLHRPYVDNFSWQCQCGGWYKRINEIADIWFDSGCVPFASYHYPFENKKEIDKNIFYPLDFIIEGVDQTRGWFYSLLVIGTLIKNSPPYKNILVNGFVLDQIGKKMSKSLGNVIDPMEIIEKEGADLLRFYLFSLNDIYDNKKFSEEKLGELKREFFNLLYNIYRFYRFYYQGRKKNYKKEILNHTLDIWFKARLKEAYDAYFNYWQNFNLHKASVVLIDLVADFSRWWVRRSRSRFQNAKNNKEFLSALINFENFFFSILKMLAPLAPFTAEYFYLEIKDEIKDRYLVKPSIHLENLGRPLKINFQEKLILTEMKKIRELASQIHSLRKEKGIKLRQPLRSLTLKTKFSPEILDILKEEVNVLKIKFDPHLIEDFILDFKIDNELLERGLVNDFIRFIQDLRQDAGLTPKETVFLKIEAPELLKNVLEKNLKILNQKTKSKTGNKIKTIIAEKEFIYEELGKVKIVLYN